MKTRMLITLLCAIALCLGSLGSAFAGSGIVGSRHDMNQFMTNQSLSPDNQGRVCAYCHTPHHANISDGPLWSRPDTAEIFTAYDTPTFSQAAAVTDPLAGPTRLCMSCHDGTIAVDTYYTSINAGGTGFIFGDEYGEFAVGEFGDISNDHPVGFSYSAAEAADNASGNTNIHPATTTFIGGTVTIADVLYDGDTMTCSTCHDVHDGPDTGTNGYLLYGAQTNSGLCLTCHNK